MRFDEFIELLRNNVENEISQKKGLNFFSGEVMISFDKATIKALIEYAKRKGIPLD